MKSLFSGKKHFVWPKGILVLCILQLSLFAEPVRSQEQAGERKMYYGLHLGFSGNRIDLYGAQGSEVQAMDNQSFYAPGLRIAVIGDLQMGRYFSLRAMPGVMLFGRSWEPEGIAVPSIDYKVESVLGELPVDVKFHPFRKGNRQPYLCAGLHYGFDFASLRKDVADGNIQRLNAHDLRYTCGLGLDCDTRFLRVGVELKAGFGLLAPHTGGTDRDKPLYFHGGPTFGIGINIEA